MRKKLRIVGVGEVLLERSVRAKYISLSVRPFKGARVAVPRGVSFDKASAFVQSKADWLKSRMGRIELIEQEASALRKNNPIDRTEARTRLVRRLAQLAARHGFSYNRVFVRNQKTRWGSCSSANNINLNINLARLPRELMDYIILHELVHTRVKNHSPRFWEMLGRHIPDPKIIDRRLNRYSPLLAG